MAPVNCLDMLCTVGAVTDDLVDCRGDVMGMQHLRLCIFRHTPVSTLDILAGVHVVHVTSGASILKTHHFVQVARGRMGAVGAHRFLSDVAEAAICVRRRRRRNGRGLAKRKQGNQ